MNRRTLLAAIAAGGTALGGCLDETPDSAEGTNERPELPYGSGDRERSPTPTGSEWGECGPAAESLSTMLVERDGDASEWCFEGATPSLTIENERDEALDTAIDVTGADGGSVFSKTYTLSPGERIVERAAVKAHGEHEVSVSIDGETVATGSWTGTSCYRHGIAITQSDVEVGLVPPLEGPGDTEHDCYAGDGATIGIYNGDVRHVASVRVVDRCDGDVFEKTYELDPGTVERIRGVIHNGGIYDVTIDVENGATETYGFFEQCWGVSANVDEDGAVTIHEIPID